MKIVHAVQMNQSGMHRLAQNMVVAEQALGNDSMLIDAKHEGQWALPQVLNADLYVIHSIFPKGARHLIETAQNRKVKTVFVAHGIPEYAMDEAVKAFEQAQASQAESFGDVWFLLRHWLKEADAFVTFNPRHAALYDRMVPSERKVDVVPMGVDRAFWSAPCVAEPMLGNPCVWMSENQNRIKWALDTIIAWPFVMDALPEAHLHAHWIPLDLHRFFIDLANANGAAYGATIDSLHFTHQRMKELWQTAHFILSPTRYGDITLLAMEANAAGRPLITYKGNEYAQFWLEEGDQRRMAEQLVAIFKGEVKARPVLQAPDLSDMGRAMLAVYARVLGLPTTQSVGTPPLQLVVDEPSAVAEAV